MKTYFWLENDALFDYCGIAFMANSLEEARDAAISSLLAEHRVKLDKLRSKLNQDILSSENPDLDVIAHDAALNSEIKRYADLVLYIIKTMPTIEDTKWYEAL